MTALIEERVKDFDALSGSADALEQLEASMLGPLCQYVQQADCSGGFVLLSVSLNPDAAADSLADFMCSAATPSIPPAICCSTGAWRTSVVSIG